MYTVKLYILDITGTTLNSPVYGGVLISEVLNVHMQCEGWMHYFGRCPLVEVSLLYGICSS